MYKHARMHIHYAVFSPTKNTTDIAHICISGQIKLHG